MDRDALVENLALEMGVCACSKKSLGNLLEEGVLMRGFLAWSDFLSLPGEESLLCPLMKYRKYDIPVLRVRVNYN